MGGMKVQKSKFFFLFLLNKYTTKNQIRFVLSNSAEEHIQAIIEICYNLLKNNFIKITPSLKETIRKHKTIIERFTFHSSRSIQRKILNKYFALFYSIIVKSKVFITKVFSQ